MWVPYWAPMSHPLFFRVRMNPHKRQSSHLQLYTLLHTRKLYTLNSYAKMFTVEDSIFPNTWIQFSNPKLNYHKKSQLVTFTSAKLNERKQSLCNILLNYN